MTPMSLAAVRHHIAYALGLLWAPGDVHEIRILKAGRAGTISGYFDSIDAAVDAVLAYDGHVPGIYYTLNPTNPALLARAANRLKERADATSSDADVIARHWLLLDFDPKRPAGISSSDAEHGRAISVACGVWDELRSAGWPDPIVADSGNGAHLLYRINAPNDATTTAKVKALLAGVADRCATADVDIDLTVYNAARITKLYGTLTCKGDSTPARPHRRSLILEAPAEICGVRL